MMYTHLDAKQPSHNICNHHNNVIQSQDRFCEHSSEVHQANRVSHLPQTLNKDTSFSDQPAEHTVIGDNSNVERHLKETDQIISEAKQKDSKKYLLPVPTIDNLISPVPDEKSSMTSAQCSEKATETLILQESTAGLNSSGVLKVTAKSMIDIPENSPYSSLLYTDLLMKDLRSVSSENHIRSTTDPNSVKRSSSELPDRHLAKRAKFDDDLFQMSDDEEENRNCFGDGDPNIYHCKHCSYSNNDIKCTVNHYQCEHPHVQLNLVYIKDPTDFSATFRCLECPVEVSNEDNLKRHYKETHPQAPEVTRLRLNELVFKCFVCTFVTDKCSILKEHYKEKHPEYNLENPLIFCRYSVSLQLKADGNEQSNKTPQETSPKKSTTQSTEYLDTSLPSSPTHKKAHAFFYHCSKCSFRHKSAVALHVHYQKTHPDVAITINKIKQSSSLATTESKISPPTPKSDTPKLVSESPAKVTENLTPRKSGCDLSTRRKETTSQTRERVLMSLMKLKGTLVVCKKPESSTSKEVNGEKEMNKGGHELGKMTTDSVSQSPKVCSFSSANVKNVVTHNNTEHTMPERASAEEGAWYSTKIQKEKPEAGAPGHSNAAESQANPAVSSKNVDALTLYEFPENLFYCQKCNFGNISLKGVVNHQSVAHKYISSSRECIIEHTAELRDQIKKLKSQTKNSPLSSYLPPPLINVGDEKKLFCHICNFRAKSMSNVLKHYYSRHPNFVAKTKQITEYTAMILQQPQTEQGNPTVKRKKKRRKQEKKGKLFQQGMASRPSAVEQAKTFECYRCGLRYQGLTRLRKHMWKDHHSNRPNIQLLGFCFRKGLLEPGYYCNKCGFSHTRAEVVHEHFKEYHPKQEVTLQFVSTKLYVGPEVFPNKRRKQLTKNVTDVDSWKTPNDGTPSPKASSFKGDSSSSITPHFSAVHPCGLQDDDPVPDVSPSEKTVTNLHIADEHQDTTEAGFDSYQVPIEYESPTESSQERRKNVKCLYCHAVFTSQRGLNTHCGLLHQATEIRTQIQVHVCLYCTYVNTSYQGVMTHCQMKHPDFESQAKNVYLNEVHVRSWEDCKGDGTRLRGYVCKRCPQIFGSQERLDKHSAFECKKHTGSQKVKKKYSTYSCQHCDVAFSTRFALNNHLRTEHKGEGLYQCALCRSSYTERKKLGKHYSKSHGKKALAKHFTAAYQQDTQSAPISPGNSLSRQTLQPSSPSAAAGDSNVLVFKCSRCPYINTSCTGTLTHCQMRHPKLTVCADKLSTQQVLRSNLFKCDNVSRSNGRGYICDICAQIFKSLLHLKNHNRSDHNLHQENKLTNKAEGQNSKGQGCTSKSNAVAEDSRSQPAALGAGPLKDRLFRCRLCSYKGLHRQNLQHHYKKIHKLNTASAYKLMDKYNMRKRNFQISGNGDGDFKCKLCPNVAFTLPLFLINHYSTFHRRGLGTDFRVLAHMTDRSTGVYSCGQCQKRINGVKNLGLHLDRHRAWKKKKMSAVVATPSPQVTYKKVHTEKDSSVCEPVMPTSEVTLQRSPTQRPPLPPDQPLSLPPDPPVLAPHVQQPQLELEAEPELGASGEKQACKQCQRSFMSLKGLRSHERSHAALAAIKKLDNMSTLALNRSINEYVIHKPGTLRPYLCSICAFRSTATSLLRCHFIKKHQDVISEAAAALNPDKNETDNQDPDLSAEHDSEPETVEELKVNKSVYMEPADVQRQLNYFSSMLQRSQGSQSIPTDSCLLNCEFCNFNTGHLSSVRRHYLTRHGKRIYRCKDCDFFTGLRKTFDLHLKNGHSNPRSKFIQQKDLCCPFCLYESNNKNHMIDHILLHREERVVPIEVRRSKLSRYLEGIVFRCHKCTFSCGSSDGLRVHMKKHLEVKPYRCRLCFFDSALLSQLEEHLSQKHQVVRNHELVGQVILDKLGVDHEGVQEKEPLSIDLKGDVVLKPDIEDKPIARKSRSADVRSETGTHCGAASRFCKLTEQAAESNELNTKKLGLGTTDGGASHKNCAMKTDQDITIKIEQSLCDEDYTKSDGQKMFNRLPPSSVGIKTCLRHDSGSGPEEVCHLNSEETADLYADMPVLENEFLKDAQVSLKKFKEEDNGGERKDGGTNSKAKDEVQEERGLFTNTSAAASEIVRLSVAEDRWYVCTLCGRKLASSWELKRHAMRHGI